MAAPSIAFEAPENSLALTPSQSRPIDLVYLATQTQGDKVLELETLQAFARQARACLQAISAQDTHAEGAKRLKTAAEAVGAHRVSAAAESLASEGFDAGRLAAVGAAVVEAENFILKLARY